MRVKFKSRKRVSRSFFKLSILLIIAISSFILVFKIFYNNLDIELDSNAYLNYLVNDAYSKFSLSDLTSLSSTEFLLKYSFGIEKFNSGTPDVELTSPVVSEVEDTKVTNEEPIIYIFNSHQTESYRADFADEFNINNTVYLASHILKEYLGDLGLSAIVEENNIVDVLNTNGWKYGSSYKASRILLEQAKKDHPSLRFFIDLHRDAASYERTTVTIDDKKYAKIMFVIGLKHENYAPNLALANDLNERIKSFNADLTRGVMQKDNAGANGIYNQDFDPNTILIEVGGQYNYIEEVNNTLKAFANILYEYFQGEQ